MEYIETLTPEIVHPVILHPEEQQSKQNKCSSFIEANTIEMLLDEIKHMHITNKNCNFFCNLEYKFLVTF